MSVIIPMKLQCICLLSIFCNNQIIVFEISLLPTFRVIEVKYGVDILIGSFFPKQL
jgi:hypothetical protein